ncbi:MAG: O-antigen ligase family protein [Limisphaerales bacterium]
MPPFLALLLTFAFIVYLFRRDSAGGSNVTSAVWLPLMWMFINESKTLCEWLSTFGVPIAGGISLQNGTPLDAFVYVVLIVAGFLVLKKRQISIQQIVQSNGWLAAFLAYCFLAIIWSDFPIVSLKHWIKVIGNPIMVLILLTEADPLKAVMTLLKRSAYLFVPLSVLAIKYYPNIGRSYDAWTGAQTTNGIAEDKNMLGCACMIMGCFFVWNLLKTLGLEKSKERRNETILTVFFLCLIGWLFLKANCATSLISLFLCIALMSLAKLPFVNKRLLGTYLVVAALVLVLVQVAFGTIGDIANLSGHDETYVGRTKLWKELLQFPVNPILGAGFESFWLGDRLKQLWAEHWWHPTEAHNGYLETYLNLGLVGLFMLGGLIVATFKKAIAAVARGDEFGPFRFGFLGAVLAYNWTEAGFRGLDPVWFTFFIVALDYPAPQPVPVVESTETSPTGVRMTLAVARTGSPLAKNETACQNLSQTSCSAQGGR